MRKLSLPLIFTFTVLLSIAQPRLFTFELESNIAATAFNDRTLVLAFTNSSVTIFSMPYFEALASTRLTYETPPIGMGFLRDSRLVVAFSNGTIVFLNPHTGSFIGREKAFDITVYKAVVGGNWIVFLEKYNYRTEKGFVKLDRLLVYDTNLKAITFVLDRDTGRLVYAFDVKIVSNMMLLTWIDTTCEICKLDDTFVTLYDLSTGTRIFIERFGECKFDFDPHAMVAVRTVDGRGLYYDISAGRKYTFEVPGKPLDVRVSGSVGYVLARDPSTGAVSLYRVHGDFVSKIESYPSSERNYALLIFEGEPAVAAPSFIMIKGVNYKVATYPIPWAPRVVAEGPSWAAILYGRSVLTLLGLVSKKHVYVNVTITTEPFTFLNIKEINLTVQADEKGVVTLNLPRGEYTVTAWKEGFRQNETRIVVGSNDEKIVIKLESEGEVEAPVFAKGFLNITVVGADEAIVEVLNGTKKVVSSTVSQTFKLELQPGEYQVIARVNGCSDRANATVSAGKVYNVLLSLECHTAPPAESPVEEGLTLAVNLSLLRAKLAEYTQLKRHYQEAIPLNLPFITDLEGRTLELSKGVKIVVFFYTKCTGCSFLIPKLKELTAEVIMVAPTAYDDENSLRSYAVEVNASGWAWALDRDAQLAALFNVSAFPTVVLLNNGRVEFVGVGAAEEVYHLAEIFLGNLMKSLDVLRDPAVVALILGLLLAYLGRGSEGDQREI